MLITNYDGTTGTLLSGGVPKNYYTIGGMKLKKSDLKGWMIVETGYGNEKYILMAGKLVNSEMEGYDLDDFDENLVHKKFKPESISKVYAPVTLKFPFELNVEKIFSEQNPQLLWKREPTKVSRKFLEKLNHMGEKERRIHLDDLVFPVIVVE